MSDCIKSDSPSIRAATLLTIYPQCHRFYYVKTNPKDIRRSCGQRVAAPAPSGPLARPLCSLTPPPTLPGFWSLFQPPLPTAVCESPAGALTAATPRPNMAALQALYCL